jgi:hypothetical protein
VLLAVRAAVDSAGPAAAAIGVLADGDVAAAVDGGLVDRAVRHRAAAEIAKSL